MMEIPIKIRAKWTTDWAKTTLAKFLSDRLSSTEASGELERLDERVDKLRTVIVEMLMERVECTTVRGTARATFPKHLLELVAPGDDVKFLKPKEDAGCPAVRKRYPHEF